MRALLLAAVLLLTAVRIQAATITYTDRVAWDAAALPDLFVTLDTFAPDRVQPVPNGQLTYCADAFCTGNFDNALHLLTFDVNQGDPTGGAMTWPLAAQAVARFSLTDAGAFTAFGFDVSGSPVHLHVNGTRFTSPSFIGFISDVPLHEFSVSLQAINPDDQSLPNGLSLDNFAFSRAVSVPEPNTLLLWSVGISLLMLRRRREALLSGC